MALSTGKPSPMPQQGECPFSPYPKGLTLHHGITAAAKVISSQRNGSTQRDDGTGLVPTVTALAVDGPSQHTHPDGASKSTSGSMSLRRGFAHCLLVLTVLWGAGETPQAVLV